MSVDKLFRIREMAKLFHMSMSTLRHYENIGLLKPEKVDQKNGYRYYSVRQFEALNTVRYLRALDMPQSASAVAGGEQRGAEPDRGSDAACLPDGMDAGKSADS